MKKFTLTIKANNYPEACQKLGAYYYGDVCPCARAPFTESAWNRIQDENPNAKLEEWFCDCVEELKESEDLSTMV